MGLHIDDPEVSRLIAEVAAATGVSETEAPTPLEERVQRLREGLERDVWSKLPPEVRGKPIPQEEQDEILGYGPDGYCTPSGDFSLTDVRIA